MRKDLAHALAAATEEPGIGVAEAALVIARLEYPQLDPAPYLARLDQMGAAARDAIARRAETTAKGSTLAAIDAINNYLFNELGFAGNHERYDDPRNSCLNQVIDRRIGIPITLSLVYMEVARRAGLSLDGVNFPGHFLVRCDDRSHGRSGLIIDPYHGGALLSEQHCRGLLQRHVGEDVAFDRALLAPATRVQIVTRMLINLKRLYVQMRSFPQARDVTDLLVTVTPAPIGELRDRGLLAYHLNDVTGALRDLQTYLKLASMSELDDQEREERQQIWEHVKTLRRRVAGLN
jgi:regulator of sirC expression with transglutaminase-like and TPR domain